MSFRKPNLCKSILMFSAISLSACGGSSIVPTPPVPSNPGGGSGNTDQQIPDGIWIQKGFGRALDVASDTIQMYDYTRESCLSNDTVTQDDLTSILNVESVESEEIIFSEDKGLLIFSKRDALPPACLDNRLITENGPVATLDHFINNFDDYYPFFEIRGISNWDERTRNARLQVNNLTTEDDLFGELITLLSGLNDGHVSLNGPDEISFSPADQSEKLFGILASGFENQSEITDFNEYVDLQFQRLEIIRNSYFDDGVFESAGGEAQEIFQWATIGNGRIGYLEISSMGGLSETDSESNSDVAEDLMDRALTDLANTEALIVNVWSNDGGDLAVADAIASRFSTDTVSVISYQAISYDDSATPQLTPLIERELEPTERVAYDRPVATISGPNTFSAGEHFLMSMRALNHPTCFIGEPSDGILSPVLSKKLPTEGVQLNLGNAIVYDHTGQSFEASGIPVDVDAVTFALADADTDRNEAIDAALIALGFGDLVNSSADANDCAMMDARTRFELSAP